MSTNDVLVSSLIYLSIILSTHSIRCAIAILIIAIYSVRGSGTSSSSSSAFFAFVSRFVVCTFITYFLYFLRVILLLCTVVSIALFYPARWLTDWLQYCLSVEAMSVPNKEEFAKWAWHHYMFNGMQLFVWPKKMEIRLEQVIRTALNSTEWLYTDRVHLDGKFSHYRKLRK